MSYEIGEITHYTIWVRSGAEPPRVCPAQDDMDRWAATVAGSEGEWPEWDAAICLYREGMKRYAIMRFYHSGKPLPSNGKMIAPDGLEYLYFHEPIASLAANVAMLTGGMPLHTFFDAGNRVGGLATQTAQPVSAVHKPFLAM